MGCVMQTGEQSNNMARNAIMASKLAGERARHLDRPPMRLVAAGAAFRGAAVMSGAMDCVIAARRRVDDAGADGPFVIVAGEERIRDLQEPGIEKRYANIVFSQFTGAEMMAEKYGLSKDDLDQYAYESHQRAIAATQAGKFKDEIIPLQITAPTARPTPTISMKAFVSMPAWRGSRA